MFAKAAVFAISLALGSAFTAGAAAQEACGLCARSVVINSSLARCFLDKYPDFASRAAAAVAVNLDDCEESRSVVPALRGPSAAGAEPTRKFFLSLPQLVCLKRKLEEPDLVLDPSAQIDLGSC
ncbi:MAG: hypothetical protein JJ913_08550 [Rhizobiaceae bacterium]|nr:hypothetical protein [Rhizobiaceae bacterium]